MQSKDQRKKSKFEQKSTVKWNGMMGEVKCIGDDVIVNLEIANGDLIEYRFDIDGAPKGKDLELPGGKLKLVE